MKAVAGAIAPTREIPMDDFEEEEEEIPKAPPHFLPVIERMYGLMVPSAASDAKETECFGHLWEDAGGTCPEAPDCHISTQCKAVYVAVVAEEAEAEAALEKEIDEEIKVEAQVDAEIAEEELEEVVKAAPATPPAEANKGAWLTPSKKKKPGRKSKGKSKKRDLQQTQRGSYKKTPKYDRHGYFDMGRPVDKSIRRLVHELGYPFELPKTWAPSSVLEKFGHKGRLLSSKTASYHLFVVDGQNACRVWTNAAGYSIVDLSPLLVAKLKTLKVEVAPIPSKSKGTKKYKDFEGRFYMKSEDDAERLSKWVYQSYKIKDAVTPATKTKSKAKKSKSRA